jgi:FixJ family two-component response regulator
VHRAITPIYIVDDDESVRKAVKRLLTSYGHVVQAFESAEAFLASVNTSGKGIIILDKCMPGMGGMAFQEKLMQLSSPMNIIFVTAFATLNDRELALKRGASGFLLKPFDHEVLLELIDSVP